MKLYTYWRSSSAYRVRIALAWKGIAYEPVFVHLIRDGGEQRKDGYADVNAMAQIPVLEWDDAGTVRRLTQSLAILHYLESIAPSHSLVPHDPLRAAEAWEIAEIVNSGIQPLQNLTTLERVDAVGLGRSAWARPIIEKGLHAIERLARANGTRFCIGDSPSVADVCLVPQLYNARRFEVDLAPFETLRAIDERCAQIDAFAAAHPDQQPDRE